MQHVVLTLIAVGVGMVIAFAAAIFAYKRSWFETPFSLFSAFLYTIPAWRCSSCSSRSPGSTA